MIKATTNSTHSKSMYMEFKNHWDKSGGCFFSRPLPPGDAGSVRSGQQPRRSDAAEAGGADGPQPKGHSGQSRSNPHSSCVSSLTFI